jgi:hypothetical protein
VVKVENDYGLNYAGVEVEKGVITQRDPGQNEMLAHPLDPETTTCVASRAARSPVRSAARISSSLWGCPLPCRLFDGLDRSGLVGCPRLGRQIIRHFGGIVSKV